MPRRARATPGGYVYVLNRSVAGPPLFRKEADFEAFERIMIEAHGLHPLRILGWCAMRTHWHFVVWPREEGEVTAFFRWLAHTHAMRWHVRHNTVGRGHLYQGRFKSFPVQEDDHFFMVCRYVERNALTAQVVERAEDWRWGSLWARHQGSEALQAILSDWPLERPRWRGGVADGRGETPWPVAYASQRRSHATTSCVPVSIPPQWWVCRYYLVLGVRRSDNGQTQYVKYLMFVKSGFEDNKD